MMIHQLEQIQMTNMPHCTSDTESFTCPTCGRTIQRLNLTLLGRSFRPLPVCNCQKEKFLAEEREREIQLKRQRILRLYGDGLMDEELKQASFDNFQLRPGTEKAYNLSKDFINWAKEYEAGLYLFGPVGQGKSHLAAAIHHQLLAEGYASVFINVNLLFRKIRSTFGKSNISDFDYINAAIQCEYLTLDELGLKRLTKYEFGILYDILDGRKGKITNFTSNLDFKRLEKWFKFDSDDKVLDEDGRAFDRIAGSVIPVQFTADGSFRQYKLQQRVRRLKND